MKITEQFCINAVRITKPFVAGLLAFSISSLWNYADTRSPEQVAQSYKEQLQDLKAYAAQPGHDSIPARIEAVDPNLIYANGVLKVPTQSLITAQEQHLNTLEQNIAAGTTPQERPDRFPLFLATLATLLVAGDVIARRKKRQSYDGIGTDIYQILTRKKDNNVNHFKN